MKPGGFYVEEMTGDDHGETGGVELEETGVGGLGEMGGGDPEPRIHWAIF